MAPQIPYFWALDDIVLAISSDRARRKRDAEHVLFRFGQHPSGDLAVSDKTLLELELRMIDGVSDSITKEQWEELLADNERLHGPPSSPPTPPSGYGMDYACQKHGLLPLAIHMCYM